MAETAPRIRWEGPDSSGTLAGHVGTLSVWVFRIYRDGGKGWRLDCELPGWDGVPAYSHSPEKLQGRAETWLGKFTASLGAAFPGPAEDCFDDDGEPLEVKYASGRRVRYVHPDAGYPGERDAAAASLVLGEVYIIGWADVGQSRTNLNLYRDGAPVGSFNSVFFELADDPATSPVAGEKE